MDTFIIAAIVFLVVVALAPLVLMRGQFRKPKGKAGADGASSNGGGDGDGGGD